MSEAPTAANDDAEPHRMVVLMGEVHDDGRVERLEVAQLLRVPASALKPPPG